MIEVAGMTLLVILIWGAVALGLLLLKTVLWMVFLPVRLLFYVLLLPLLFLVKTIVGGALLLVIGPVLAIAMIAGLVALAAAIIVPLLPLAFVAFAIWFVVRLSRGAPAATRV